VTNTLFIAVSFLVMVDDGLEDTQEELYRGKVLLHDVCLVLTVDVLTSTR